MPIMDPVLMAAGLENLAPSLDSELDEEGRSALYSRRGPIDLEAFS